MRSGVYLLVSACLRFGEHDAPSTARGLAMVIADLKSALRASFAAQWRRLAGAAFVCLALVSIAYDEALAPHMDRWTHAASELTRKLGAVGS